MPSSIATRHVSAPASSRTQVTQCDGDPLLDRLQAGDSQAYETLVRQHGPRMLATARRFFECEHEANDAVQDAFLSAFKSIHRFQGDSQLGTWLHRIVVNACLMRRRSSARRPCVSIENLLPTFDESGHHAQKINSYCASPCDALTTRESRQQVRDCIDSLADPYRTVLILRDIEQFDTDTTASLLNVSVAVVKTRLHRARQALRSLLEPLLQQV